MAEAKNPMKELAIDKLVISQLNLSFIIVVGLDGVRRIGMHAGLL